MSTKHSTRSQPQMKQRLPGWLPVIVVVGLALIGVAVASSNNTPPAAPPTLEVHGAPAVKVDQEQVDFGDVKLGQTVEVKFQVTNVGDQILMFKKAPYVQVIEGC